MAFIEKQLPKESLILKYPQFAFRKDNMKLSWWLWKGEEGTVVCGQKERAEPSVTFSDFLQLYKGLFTCRKVLGLEQLRCWWRWHRQWPTTLRFGFVFWGAFPSGMQTGFGFFYLRWGFSLTRVQTWIASGLALPVGPWHVVPVQLLAAVPVLPVALSLQPCEMQLLPPHPPILRAAGSRQGCAACPGRKRSLNNQTNSSCIAVFAGYSR